MNRIYELQKKIETARHELDEALLQEMYERYQPEYVWMPKKKGEQV